MKYITKPEKQITVEAYHFLERCSIDVAPTILPEWLLNRNDMFYLTDSSKTLWGISIAPTDLRSVYFETAYYGDWIVKFKKGNALHVYKDNEFDKRFMEVNDET